MSTCRRTVTVTVEEPGLCTCIPPLQHHCRDDAISRGEEPLYPHRPMFAVDWDGTCVEEVWPGMGDWLPGAVEALRALSALGKVVIYSLRCHLYEEDDRTPRPRGAPGLEEDAIRRKLTEAGLTGIDVYPPNRGKPPARYYIDDRGVRFNGDWMDTIRFVKGDLLRRELEQDG